MKKTFIASFVFLISACSVYESGGRKALENNEGDIIGAYGVAGTPSDFYFCSSEKSEPEFLKSPLEVIETTLDAENFTTLYNAESTPPSVIVYTVDSNNKYSYCRVSHFSPLTKSLSIEKILQFSNFAANRIKQIYSQTRP